MPPIPTLGEAEASLVYIPNSRPAKAAWLRDNEKGGEWGEILYPGI